MNTQEEIKNIPDSPVYFLGLCDKYNELVIARRGLYEVTRTDLIGLRHFYISSLFPFGSDSFFLVFLVDTNFVSEVDLVMKVKKVDSVEEIDSISLKGEMRGNGNRFPTRFALTAGKIPGSYSEPGYYKIVLEREGSEIIIGEFNLTYIPALPLTTERIEAIKSDPLVAKYIKVELRCNNCHSSIKAVTGIKRKEEDLKDGSIWQTDLPDRFVCSCEKLNRDLRYWKESLHSMLGYKPSPFTEPEQIERNYTRSALNKIIIDFKTLIDTDKNEEELQKFMENNPIVLTMFSPELLKYKAPATAKYKTDFALLNQKNELVLIEIEKSSTPLYTKGGVQHSKLTQSINQAENWLQEARRNKLGLIDDLGIQGLKIDMVNNIRAVVIAGKSLPEYDQHIGKLRSRTDIDFYTYDDMYNYLRNMTLKIQDI